MMIHRHFIVGNTNEIERHLVHFQAPGEQPPSLPMQLEADVPPSPSLPVQLEADVPPSPSLPQRLPDAPVKESETDALRREVLELKDALAKMQASIDRLKPIAAAAPQVSPQGEYRFPNLRAPRSPQARKAVSKYIRGRYYDQHFPKRYVRNMVRPSVVRIERPDKPKSPYRTRYNRIDGMYYELLDVASGQYVRGPSIQSQKQILEQRKLDEARHQANREGALMIMRDFNNGRSDPKWNYNDHVRALESLNVDTHNARPKSVRMAEVHRDVSIGMAMPEGPAFDMPVEQSRTFRTYIETRGPFNSAQMQLEKDGAGNIVITRGEIVHRITPSGEFQERIVKQNAPAQPDIVQNVAPIDVPERKKTPNYDNRWKPTSYGENIPFPS